MNPRNPPIPSKSQVQVAKILKFAILFKWGAETAPKYFFHQFMKKILTVFAAQIALLAFFGCQQQTPSSSAPANGQMFNPIKIKATATIRVLPNNQNGTQQQMQQTQEVAAATIVIAQKMFTLSGKSYTLSQICSGTVGKGADNLNNNPTKIVNFCVGQNTLQLTMPDGKTNQINNLTAFSALDAPVLLDAALIPDSSTLLISYSPNECDTASDCDEEIPTNYVTMAVNLDTGTPHNLVNFPADGTPAWDSSHTKALFIPQTCTGDEPARIDKDAGKDADEEAKTNEGCKEHPLIGYNLDRDYLDLQLTADQAAGDDTMSGQKGTPDFNDATGKKLPYWKSVKWTGADNFEAVISQTDGTEKTVSGTF
jgi:hypothetical protein